MGDYEEFSQYRTSGFRKSIHRGPGDFRSPCGHCCRSCSSHPRCDSLNAFTGSLARFETELYGFAGDFINLVERKIAPPKARRQEE
jgi:hypothetical protein